MRTGDNNTGDKFFPNINDTGEQLLLVVTMTPALTFFSLILVINKQKA
jgi:hypothetical protein